MKRAASSTGTVEAERPANEDRKRGARLYPRRGERTYWVLESLRREMESIVQEIPATPAPLLIDYGCGNMPYRPLFRTRGLIYRGYDFERNDMADGHLTEEGGLPLEAESAEVVLSSQVLEHVENPLFYLSECFRVLRRDGTLILSTHGSWRYHPDPADYWRWTSAGLRRQLGEAGFELRQFRGVGGTAAAGIQLFQDSVLRSVPQVMRRPFCFLCQGAMQLADRWTSSESRKLDAALYLCLAVKSPRGGRE